MSMTDPIADMLTRIRNASSARHRSVDVPASGIKRSLPVGACSADVDTADIPQRPLKRFSVLASMLANRR